MKTPATFTKESDLCAAFIAVVEKGGKWTCYAETEGWDILLVRKADGFQIGVEAKLKFNAKVIAQTLEEYYFAPDMPGPDCRAVLVPPENSGGDGLSTICAYIGVSVIRLFEDKRPWSEKSHGFKFNPQLPDDDPWQSHWLLWCPTKRHPLPEYVPDVTAGASSPTQLTPWKIAAIKIAIITESRPVTRHDFKELKIDHRRWLPSGAGWLTPAEGGGGWVRSKAFPDFKAAHPVNYEQIKADAAKWMPAGLAPAKQEAML